MDKLIANIGLLTILRPEGIDKWWSTEIPAFDGLTPTEMWELDPNKVMDLIDSYRDMSFG